VGAEGAGIQVPRQQEAVHAQAVTTPATAGCGGMPRAGSAWRGRRAGARRRLDRRSWARL